MSVWRIDKVDAQTRALAEAAAKAAGLPLGMWLERAIMRRVENRATPAQPPIIPAAIEEPPAPEPDLSPEMKAALEAAERRRHRRGDKTTPGIGAANPAPRAKPVVTVEAADPFAAPEPDSHDTPFEQPLETTRAAEAADPLLKLEDDVPIAITDEPRAAEPLFADTLEAATVEPPLVEIAPAVEAAAELPPIVTPSWQDASEVTTTGRQSILPSQSAPSAPRRIPSSLPFIAVGLLVVVAASAGAYFFLTDSGAEKSPKQASSGTTPPAAETAKPVNEAAAPKTEPPAPPPNAAASAPTPAPTPAPPPAPAPVQEQAQPAPPPPLPRPSGPSLANLGAAATPARPSLTPMSQLDPTAPAAAAQPAPAAAAQAGKPPLTGEALPILRNRAEAGDMEAQIELGRRYIEGIGVGRNEAEAGKWLLRAADQGNAQAQFNVGVMYERGVGLAPSLPKALEYYRKSAAQNTPMALHNLALFHTSDQPGYKSDPAQARRLMTQSSELGLAESQYSLGLMYLQAVGGPADRVLGLSWMVVAARPNMPQLIEAVRQLSTQFTEAERIRARELAEGHVRRIQANLQRLRTSAAAAPAAATADAAAAKPRVIDRAAIMEMQKLLAGLKIYGGTADGAMGPRTTAAIKEFQAMAGMPVDGKPSVELLDNLRDVSGLSSQ